VGCSCLAAADVEDGAGKFVNAEKFETDGGADDIEDGVDRSDFVEMDLVYRDLVDFGFGFGEAGENFSGTIGGAGGEGSISDALEDDREVAMMVVFAGVDFDVGGEEGSPLDFFGGDGPVFEAEFAEFGFDGAEGGTGVDQGAEDHIAADAGEAVEIGYPYGFHEIRPPRRSGCEKLILDGKEDGVKSGWRSRRRLIGRIKKDGQSWLLEISMYMNS